MSSYRFKQKLFKIIQDILIVLCVAIVLIPLIWFVQIAFKPEVVAWEMPPKFIFVPTFEHFQKIFSTKSELLHTLLNSAIVSVATTALTLLLGLTSGYALARSKYRFSKYMGLWIVLCQMAPPMVFLLPFYNMFRSMGISGTYLALIISFQVITLPFVTWMLYGYFKTIPKEIEESAMIDGCTRLQLLFRISAPIAKPGIVTCVMFAFIYSWNEFLFALILSGSKTKTVPILIQGFLSSDGYEWGSLAATAFVVVLPVLLISALNQKGLVRGLAGGAVK